MKDDGRPSLERILLKLHEQGFSEEEAGTCCRLMSHDIDDAAVREMFVRFERLLYLRKDDADTRMVTPVVVSGSVGR